MTLGEGVPALRLWLPTTSVCDSPSELGPPTGKHWDLANLSIFEYPEWHHPIGHRSEALETHRFGTRPTTARPWLVPWVVTTVGTGVHVKAERKVRHPGSRGWEGPFESERCTR